MKTRLIAYLLRHLDQKALLKALNVTLSRPEGFTDMDMVLVDGDGRKYYEWPQGFAMSVSRAAKVRQYYQLLANSIGPDHLREGVNAAIKHLNDHDTVKAGATLVKMMEIFDNVTNTELLINIVAVGLVREDEDAMTYSDSIHREKVTYLMSGAVSDGFFFRLTAWNQLSDQFKISQEQFIASSTAYARAVSEWAMVQRSIASVQP